MLRVDQVHVIRHKVLVEGQRIRAVARQMGGTLSSRESDTPERSQGDTRVRFAPLTARSAAIPSQ